MFFIIRAPSSASTPLSRVLAVCTRSGPLKDYIQLWIVSWSDAQGTKMNGCSLSSLLHRNSSSSSSSSSSGTSNSDLEENSECKGYVMQIHWIPIGEGQDTEEEEAKDTAAGKKHSTGSKRKRTTKTTTTTTSSSSSSSSSTSVNSAPSSLRTGIVCTVTSFGALNMHVVPALSLETPLTTIQRTLPAINLIPQGVTCVSFSKVCGNVILVGKDRGVVELWRINSNYVEQNEPNEQKDEIPTRKYGELLKTFDHMYSSRYVQN